VDNKPFGIAKRSIKKGETIEFKLVGSPDGQWESDAIEVTDQVALSELMGFCALGNGYFEPVFSDNWMLHHPPIHAKDRRRWVDLCLSEPMWLPGTIVTIGLLVGDGVQFFTGKVIETALTPERGCWKITLMESPTAEELYADVGKPERLNVVHFFNAHSTEDNKIQQKKSKRPTSVQDCTDVGYK
jgi:hypothetical protein